MPVAAASVANTDAGSSGGANPFQVATNLYAEKNVQGLITSQLLGTSSVPFGGAVNAGNYLRGVRMIVRTLTAGVAGTATADAPFSLFQSFTLTNVDGSEILYNMGGYAHYLAQKYSRPWLADPKNLTDYATGNSPAFTLFLQPEIRWTAGALANTDTRSQYRFDASLAPATAIGSGYTTNPTISVTPYMDAWAQPDATDLQGTANQPVPPGVNLQVKRRHETFSINPSGSNNTIQVHETGNALRMLILVTRNSTGARADLLSDPVLWTQDNRSLGRLSPDIIQDWMADFYNGYNRSARETGVYVFPRFLRPGDLTGQGWLYTSNATKLQFETASASGADAGSTCELITDEVYPVGPVDPTLVDI